MEERGRSDPPPLLARHSQQELENIFEEAVIYQLDVGLTALGVADKMAEHRSQLGPSEYRPFFDAVHRAMADQVNLAVTRLYDPSSDRHRTLSIPALLEFMDARAEWLQVARPEAAQSVLDGDEPPEGSEALTRALVDHYREEVPSPERAEECLLSEGLDRLRTRRNKQVAHKDADWIRHTPAAWDDARGLVEWGKGFATTVGSVYGLGPYRVTPVDDAADALEDMLTALDLPT